MTNRLTKGQIVRCRNQQNDLRGEVLVATDTNPQSVGVYLGQGFAGIRMGERLAVTNMLPLLIDYEAETVMDLFGSAWDIEVAQPS